MSRLRIVLLTIVVGLGTGNLFGQLAAIKPVSSTPLRLQSLGNRTAGKSAGKVDSFQSIQTLRGQSVRLGTVQQPDLESEIQALQQESQIPSAEGLNIRKLQDESVLPRSIMDTRINILTTGERIPTDRSAVLFESLPRTWNSFSSSELLVHWDAANICYRRLYFEDPILERYGQTSCNFHRDVIRSEAHFAVSTVMWPLRAALDFPYRCESPYGYCRPGTPLPKMQQQLITR